MGRSSVAPARRADSAPKELDLLTYVGSVAPEATLEGTTRSLIRERRADDRVAVVVLCATAGYIDAVGLITLVGLFPAHVTGELVGLTSAFTAGHHLSHPIRFAVIPTFVAALVVSALVNRNYKRRGESPGRPLVALMALALAVCAATGFLAPTQAPADFGWVYAVREGSVVAAMAFQNALTRVSPTSPYPTTVMTGNLTHFVFDLVDAIASRLAQLKSDETHSRSVNPRLGLVSTALGSFLAGAVLGGYLTGVLGALSVVVPLGGALLLARRFAQ
jgi:uncharacterized membrane protein YoaK (UPF0700 family)